MKPGDIYLLITSADQPCYLVKYIEPYVMSGFVKCDRIDPFVGYPQVAAAIRHLYGPLYNCSTLADAKLHYPELFI